MNVFKSICRVHEGMPIVDVCVSGEAAIALCAKCLNDHIRQHRKRGVDCELLDTNMFMTRYEVKRMETFCKLEQAMLRLVDSNVIQINMENSAKKFTFNCLTALEQTRAQVITLVENCFKDLRKRLEDDCTYAVKRTIKQIKDRKDELENAHRQLKQMVGVEGLAVFVSSDHFQTVLSRSELLKLERFLPDMKFTSSISQQIKDALQGCISSVPVEDRIQEEVELAKSTWVSQLPRCASSSQFKFSQLENTRESSFANTNSRGFDQIKEFMSRPASSFSLHKSSCMPPEQKSRSTALGATLYVDRQPLKQSQLSYSHTFKKLDENVVSYPKVPLVFGDKSSLMNVGITKRSVQFDDFTSSKHINPSTMSFVDAP